MKNMTSKAVISAEDEEEDKLRKENNRRVEEALKRASDQRANSRQNDDSTRGEALKRLHRMEWLKNKDDILHHRKSDEDTMKAILLPLRKKALEDYFSGTTKESKSKPRKKEYQNLVKDFTDMKIKPADRFGNVSPPPKRPPLQPPPPPAENAWAKKPGSALFANSSAATITAYGVSAQDYNEDKMLQRALQESLRTAKEEQRTRYTDAYTGLTLSVSDLNYNSFDEVRISGEQNTYPGDSRDGTFGSTNVSENGGQNRVPEWFEHDSRDGFRDGCNTGIEDSGSAGLGRKIGVDALEFKGERNRTNAGSRPNNKSERSDDKNIGEKDFQGESRKAMSSGTSISFQRGKEAAERLAAERSAAERLRNSSSNKKKEELVTGVTRNEALPERKIESPKPSRTRPGSAEKSKSTSSNDEENQRKPDHSQTQHKQRTRFTLERDGYDLPRERNLPDYINIQEHETKYSVPCKPVSSEQNFSSGCGDANDNAVRQSKPVVRDPGINLSEFQENQTLIQRNQTVFQGNQTVFQGNRTVFQGNQMVFQGNQTVLQDNQTVFQANQAVFQGETDKKWPRVSSEADVKLIINSQENALNLQNILLETSAKLPMVADETDSKISDKTKRMEEVACAVDRFFLVEKTDDTAEQSVMLTDSYTLGDYSASLDNFALNPGFWQTLPYDPFGNYAGFPTVNNAMTGGTGLPDGLFESAMKGNGLPNFQQYSQISSINQIPATNVFQSANSTGVPTMNYPGCTVGYQQEHYNTGGIPGLPNAPSSASSASNNTSVNQESTENASPVQEMRNTALQLPLRNSNYTFPCFQAAPNNMSPFMHGIPNNILPNLQGTPSHMIQIQEVSNESQVIRETPDSTSSLEQTTNSVSPTMQAAPMSQYMQGVSQFMPGNPNNISPLIPGASQFVQAIPKNMPPPMQAVTTTMSPQMQAVTNNMSPQLQAVTTSVSPQMQAVTTSASPQMQAVTNNMSPQMQAVTTNMSPQMQTVPHNVSPQMQASPSMAPYMQTLPMNMFPPGQGMSSNQFQATPNSLQLFESVAYFYELCKRFPGIDQQILLQIMNYSPSQMNNNNTANTPNMVGDIPKLPIVPSHSDTSNVASPPPLLGHFNQGGAGSAQVSYSNQPNQNFYNYNPISQSCYTQHTELPHSPIRPRGRGTLSPMR